MMTEERLTELWDHSAKGGFGVGLNGRAVDELIVEIRELRKVCNAAKRIRAYVYSTRNAATEFDEILSAYENKGGVVG